MPESSLDIPLLHKTAEAAFQHSVAPSSGFRVGAVLQTEGGVLYSGCNIESPVYLGMCAERVALFKALSEGARTFAALAIVCEEQVRCLPCGTCRQLLLEFAPGLRVLTFNDTNSSETQLIEDLLPLAFERGSRDPFRGNSFHEK